MRRTDLVAELVATLLRQELPHPLRTAIDGVDAAGKTVLSDELGAELAQRGHPVIRLSVDGFHNPSVIRRRRGALSPEGYFLDSFNYEALIEYVLKPLGPGGDLLYRERVFDFRSHVAIESPPMKAPVRSAEGLRSRYERRYIPGQRLYLDTVRPETHASVVIDNNDPFNPRIIRSA